MKFDSLIIETDTGARNRLKQAAISVSEFGKVEFQNSPHEAITRLNLPTDKCDVVFISYRFPQDQIMTFIKEAKQTKQGQDSAFVLILENDDKDASKVASNMLVGADGLLFEPFSVDQLVDITRLAARVKRERADARERAAINFMVHDIITQVDTLSSLKKLGFDVGTTLKKFRELCAVLRGLEPASQKVYHEIAVEAFINAPLPKPLAGKLAYGGVSSRVKKRMEAKVIQKLGGPTKS